MKKLLLLAALAVLCGAQAWADADQVRDGADFNTPNCARHYIRRTVDSTGTKAGRIDSAVVICAPQVMPTPMTVGGVYRPDTTSRALSLDANGNIYNQDASRDRDNNLTFANIVALGTPAGTSALAGGAADSSAVLDTHAMRLGTLLIRAYPATSSSAVDTSTTVRLIFSVRTHLAGASDSMSVFNIYHYGEVPVMNATSLVADTSVIGHIYNAVPITAVLATPSPQTAWSGEFTVLVSRSRNGMNQLTLGSHKFQYPAGIAIPLSSLFGRDVYSAFTSVRVRNASTTSCDVFVSLIGSPL